jgi:hypothetical protein
VVDAFYVAVLTESLVNAFDRTLASYGQSKWEEHFMDSNGQYFHTRVSRNNKFETSLCSSLTDEKYLQLKIPQQE